jgi:hypothetical protein
VGTYLNQVQDFVKFDTGNQHEIIDIKTENGVKRQGHTLFACAVRSATSISYRYRGVPLLCENHDNYVSFIIHLLSAPEEVRIRLLLFSRTVPLFQLNICEIFWHPLFNEFAFHHGSVLGEFPLLKCCLVGVALTIHIRLLMC